MEYNEKLRQLRVDNNMSQDDLAEKLHVARQTISKWEQGVNEPDIFTLKQYASIFDVSLDELLGDVEKTDKQAIKMRKTCKTLLIISTVFYVFCILITFVLFRFLPNEIPSHFNSNGEVDRYGSKAEVLLHLVSFTVFYAIILLMYFMGKKNIGTPMLNLENVSFVVFFSIVVAIPVGYFAFVLATTVPYLIEFSTWSLLMCILGTIELAIAISAHPKITPTKNLLGFRTKFTLTNAEAWVKVNRFASICVSVAAMLMIAANMIWIYWWVALATTITLFVALAISIVYHEVLRKKMQAE